MGGARELEHEEPGDCLPLSNEHANVELKASIKRYEDVLSRFTITPSRRQDKHPFAFTRDIGLLTNSEPSNKLSHELKFDEAPYHGLNSAQPVQTRLGFPSATTLGLEDRKEC